MFRRAQHGRGFRKAAEALAAPELFRMGKGRASWTSRKNAMAGGAGAAAPTWPSSGWS